MSSGVLAMLNGLIASMENVEDEKKVAHDVSSLNVMTWNIAGVNNNPWEYYVCLDDKNYNVLMQNVESFLTNEAKNVVVGDVLNKIDKHFFVKLGQLINDNGTINDPAKLSNDNDFDSLLKSDINKYLNMSVCDFLSNKFIGDYRLISWPDRLLNTIDNDPNYTSYIYRPTAINYYDKTLKNMNHWFHLWLQFMDDIGINLLKQNINNKYAQKYIALGNHHVFLTLNITLLSIFDAILIYLLFDIESKTKIDWQNVKNNLYNILNKNKLNNTINIVNNTYYNYDILFFQEVRNNFIDAIDDKNLFVQNYHIIFPNKLSNNNQTSIICLKKKVFDVNKVEEITNVFYANYNGKMGINNGDLIVIKIQDHKLILISFHGDTGGLATPHLLKTINKIVLQNYKDYRLIIGIDCNTYFDECLTDKKDKYSVKECNQLIHQLNMKHCFNNNECPSKHTTNCPRTYLQPQLSKAVKREEIKNKIVDFRSPKDFIICYKNQFNFVENSITLDNTGKKHYNNDVEYILPSQNFPSDHAILSASLKII